MSKKIYIIATGMNGCNTMTKQALDKLQECELFIGAKRIVALFSDLEKESLISYRYDEICCPSHIDCAIFNSLGKVNYFRAGRYW